jgi:putative oxidoreductase
MEHLGKLLLRLAVGGLLIPHGVHKAMHGIASIESLVVGAGLPAWAAYGVYVGEILAPALVVLGIFTRSSALVIVVNMGTAIYLAHREQWADLTAGGAWALELPAFFLLGALSIALLGGGRMAVMGRRDPGGAFD